jgi:hypothetical protein
MAATLLLLAGAVPFPGSEPAVAIRQRRPGGNPGAQLLQLVVREALERMLDTPHPGPPPNTPAAAESGGADRTFRFPSPSPSAVAARLRTSGRRRQQQTEERNADGNEAEDEEEEEETRHSSDPDCVERGGGGRKRGRVLSFSGASAACRRVPHKRTKEAITWPPADTADMVDAAGAGAGHNLPEALADRERARRHRTRQVAIQPAPQTAAGHQPVAAASAESTSSGSSNSSSSRVSEQEWRLLGQELRSVARKFAAASSGSAPLRRPVYSVRISAGSGDFNAGEDSDKMMVSTNVVYLAVNYMLWRLLRRLFA